MTTKPRTNRFVANVSAENLPLAKRYIKRLSEPEDRGTRVSTKGRAGPKNLEFAAYRDSKGPNRNKFRKKRDWSTIPSKLATSHDLYIRPDDSLYGAAGQAGRQAASRASRLRKIFQYLDLKRK